MEPGQLNPLLGKLQLVRAMRAAYYHAHQDHVGNERVGSVSRTGPGYLPGPAIITYYLDEQNILLHWKGDIALNSLVVQILGGTFENRVTCPAAISPEFRVKVMSGLMS